MTKVDLGDAKAGKIGLLADFNPIDFGKISAGVPKR